MEVKPIALSRIPTQNNQRREVLFMKLKLREKICYGIGDLGFDLFANFIGSYFMLFMTDVLGISPFVGGCIFGVARIWDAINDPLMGSIVEHGRPNKHGRYRKFMLYAFVPMTVFFILCFTAPNLPMAGKILYIGAIYIFYGMSSTMYQVPYGSLSSVMSTSSQDYAVLGTFRDYGANISGTVVNAIAVSMIMFFGGSMNSSRGFLFTAISIGIVSCGCLFIGFIGTREHVRVDPEPVPFKDCLKAFAANRPSQILCVMIICASLGMGFRMVWTSYYALYYLQNPDMIARILTITFSLPLVGLLFVPGLTKLIGKKAMLLIGNTCLVISGVIFLFAGNNIAWNTVAAVCCGICLSFTYSVIWGILPDTANYGEWKTGIRATGFIYAIGVFALKLGSAIANMGAGTYLQILGYDPAFGMEQTAGCAHGIYLANGWTSIVLGLIGSIVFLLFFKLDKATMDKVEHELAERRAKKVGTAE